LPRRKKLGRKVHPTGFRVGIIRDWQAKWYADKNYVQFLQEDLKLRRAIRSKYADAGISLVEIDRQGDRILVNIHTSRPGVVIGRGGQRVDEMRQYLEELIGNRMQLNILEVRQPELDAYLVAVAVAEQIQRRIAFRRVMKQAIARTIEAGAKGMRISCSGRLAGAEIARREMMHQGQVPLHKLRADIDYGFTEARTTLGRIGVKVWIYKGDILPEAVVEEAEEMPELEIPEEAAPVAGAEEKKKPVRRKRVEAEAPVAEEAAPVAEAEEKKKPVRRKKVEAEAPAAEEVAPVAEAEEKKPARRKKAEAEAPVAEEAAPVAEAEEKKKPVRRKKVEAEAPAAEEVAPVAEAEEKKPARRKKAEAEAPAAGEVAPVAEAEEKKPARRKKAEAKAPAAEEAAPVAEAEEKKPARRKKTKATSTELEETDATTEAG
jgi:small subunit ribosomal protein S3